MLKSVRFQITFKQYRHLWETKTKKKKEKDDTKKPKQRNNPVKYLLNKPF